MYEDFLCITRLFTVDSFKFTLICQHRSVRRPWAYLNKLLAHINNNVLVIHPEMLFILAVLPHWRVPHQPSQIDSGSADKSHAAEAIYKASFAGAGLLISATLQGQGPLSLSDALSFSQPTSFFSPYLTRETPKQSILPRAVPSAEWRVPFVFFLSFHPLLFSLLAAAVLHVPFSLVIMTLMAASFRIVLLALSRMFLRLFVWQVVVESQATNKWQRTLSKLRGEQLRTDAWGF